MQFIKEIGPLETFPVRQAVLRPGKPVETCHFDGDNLHTTHHYGLFNDAQLVAVITVLENPLKNFDEQRQFQIRGMAVLDEFRGKGYGDDLLLYTENQIKSQNGDLIWFNARITAVGFYEKSGYQTLGPAFEITDVGQHYVMFKKLNASNN